MFVQKSREFNLVLAALMLCFVFAGLIISCGGAAGTPEGTVKNFINTISNGDAKFAFKQYVENGEAIVAEEWEDNWDEFEEWQEKMKGMSCEIINVETGENEAVVSVRFLDKDGEELDTDDLEMKIIDGRWKISAEVFD